MTEQLLADLEDPMDDHLPPAREALSDEATHSNSPAINPSSRQLFTRGGAPSTQKEKGPTTLRGAEVDKIPEQLIEDLDSPNVLMTSSERAPLAHSLGKEQEHPSRCQLSMAPAKHAPPAYKQSTPLIRAPLGNLTNAVDFGDDYSYEVSILICKFYHSAGY